jgi:hypothetical protein
MLMVSKSFGPELCEGDGEVRAGCEEFSATGIEGKRQATEKNQYYSEPDFVNLLRSPGIDSQPGVPTQQPCLTYRPDWLHRLVEAMP